MKCIIVVATSTDGFITRGSETNVRLWTSKEEQKWFADILSRHSLQVFGSGTYDAVKPQVREGVLKVVLTKTPEKYKNEARQGNLEFHSLSPKDFVEKYKNLYESCLVLGGSHVYTEFLKARIVDEALVIVEPVVFGSGIPFLAENTDPLHYFSKPPIFKSLNSEGTSLVRYSR